MPKRWIGYVLRAALLAAFAWYLYSIYAPYRGQPFDEVLTAATIRAFNAGHPFHIAFENPDGSAAAPLKMSEFYGDYGVHILMSLAGLAGRNWYGPSFTLDSSIVRPLLVAFFVATAAAMLMPPIPLAVGAAGVVSLWALFAWGPLGLYDARYWGVAFAVCVAMVYLGAVLRPWTIGRIAALILLAAIASYAQLLRQEAGPAATVLGLALVGCAAIAWLASLRMSDASQRMMRTLAARAAGGGLLLAVANSAIVPLERWMFSRAWEIPYAETAIAVHGSGWPLYLSLGYVSNPYNIGWRDPIGELHARLIDPSIVMNADPAFQRTLLDEFQRIAIERPWLVARNVAAKAVRVHELASRPSGANTGTIITQSQPLVRIYWAAPLMLLAMLAALVWRGSVEGVILLVAGVVLAMAASGGPLIVFPEYIGGLQGATVAVVFILPAAVLAAMAGTWRTSAETADARRTMRAFAIAGGAAIVLAAAFVGVQALRYRSLVAQAAEADPLDGVLAQEFRYAHVFNDLSLARQGRVIAKLQASPDPRVARMVDERRGDLNLFAPQVAVRTAKQIHVFVWMGRGFAPPTKRLFQGSTHVSLLVCGACPPEASINDIQFPRDATMINDLEWQGRYRMFTVRSNQILDDAPFVRVTAERVRALDTSLPTWIVPELIASARLSFSQAGDGPSK